MTQPVRSDRLWYLVGPTIVFAGLAVGMIIAHFVTVLSVIIAHPPVPPQVGTYSEYSFATDSLQTGIPDYVGTSITVTVYDTMSMPLGGELLVTSGGVFDASYGVIVSRECSVGNTIYGLTGNVMPGDQAGLDFQDGTKLVGVVGIAPTCP